MQKDDRIFVCIRFGVDKIAECLVKGVVSVNKT
ncbi:hypothetical protein Thiosp_01332 [Thiorhodovibrio litoralis]|nr:hypothetical protein Thiosp_01332 [Thiorhodovibrio litoralis]